MLSAQPWAVRGSGLQLCSNLDCHSPALFLNWTCAVSHFSGVPCLGCSSCTAWWGTREAGFVPLLGSAGLRTEGTIPEGWGSLGGHEQGRRR